MSCRSWAIPKMEGSDLNARNIAMPPAERDAFRRTLPPVITPTSDDCRFFFDFYTWASLPQHFWPRSTSVPPMVMNVPSVRPSGASAAHRREFVAWAGAVNGFLSVTSSILAMTLGIPT